MAIGIDTIGERALRRLGVAVVPIADRPMLTSTVAPATIATNALIELGVIASDETPSAADQALALAKVQQVQASLISQALVWWDDTGIPMAVAEEYTRLAAMMMANAFGKSVDPQMLPVWEARVKRMAVVLSSPDEATEAVQAVHDDLSARGKVRWTVWDIPPAVELAYELLAANRLAPLYDKQADPAADIYATRAIAAYIALGTSGETVVAQYF